MVLLRAVAAQNSQQNAPPTSDLSLQVCPFPMPRSIVNLRIAAHDGGFFRPVSRLAK
jgi:hypothetical protein